MLKTFNGLDYLLFSSFFSLKAKKRALATTETDTTTATTTIKSAEDAVELPRQVYLRLV